MTTVTKVTTAGLIYLTAFSSIGANVTQINRYGTVQNKPLAAQIDPLQTVQQLHFPKQIETIGQAVTYWLRYSGFKLTEQSKQSDALQQVMSQPLPHVARHLGPLTINDGLEVLVGQRLFKAVYDPILREVNFVLKASKPPTFKAALKKIPRSKTTCA